MSSVNGTAPIDVLARQLMQTFDRNRDGRLTTEEFTSVLSSLMSATSGATAAPGAGHASAPAAAAAPIRRTSHLEGFNLDKLAASQTTKYRFARAAAEFDLTSVTDKASAESLLNSMRPTFEREGLNVLAIAGDRIQVMHEGQPIWVDVIRGANSGSPGFQWLADA